MPADVTSVVAPEVARSAAPILIDDLRDPEVQHLRVRSCARQQDVLGLEVAVEHPFAVRGLDRLTDRLEDSHRAPRLEPAFALQDVTQVLAPDQLHHEIGAAIHERAVVEDGDDRRMLQPRDDLRFAPEALTRLEVAE